MTDRNPAPKVAALAAETWIAWLVERGQPEGQSPSLYWTGDHGEAVRWTDDPWRAVQLPQAEAEKLIGLNTYLPPARAVEHSFTCDHHAATCDRCHRPVAAGYDVARIEEGERLDLADELLDADHEIAAFLHPFIWNHTAHTTEPGDGSDCHECYAESLSLREVIEESHRAALAASDEAAK